MLVRHAEKEASSGSNPNLSEKGIRRAQNLQSLFQEIKFDAIYSTDYQRTKNTAAPVARMQDLEVVIYDPRSLKIFADSILENHRGQTILVSGHSNTTPRLINLLLGENTQEMLKEDEYDWVFIVDLADAGNGKLKKLSVTVD